MVSKVDTTFKYLPILMCWLTGSAPADNPRTTTPDLIDQVASGWRKLCIDEQQLVASKYENDIEDQEMKCLEAIRTLVEQEIKDGRYGNRLVKLVEKEYDHLIGR
jgi:hypothetical protein